MNLIVPPVIKYRCSYYTLAPSYLFYLFTKSQINVHFNAVTIPHHCHCIDFNDEFFPVFTHAL